MIVKIKENPNNDFWYRDLSGETFIVKNSDTSDLFDIDGIDSYSPENYYAVTTGNHQRQIIQKKDCFIVYDDKEADKVRKIVDDMLPDEWTSVNDKLPPLHHPVLIATSYGKLATAYITDESHPDYGWTDWMRAGHGYGSVTHWMELPNEPRD